MLSLLKSFLPCKARTEWINVGILGSASGISRAVAGILKMIQCTHGPFGLGCNGLGASISSHVIAKDSALAGANDQTKAGEKFRPSAVYLGGISRSFGNPVLLSCIVRMLFRLAVNVSVVIVFEASCIHDASRKGRKRINQTVWSPLVGTPIKLTRAIEEFDSAKTG